MHTSPSLSVHIHTWVNLPPQYHEGWLSACILERVPGLKLLPWPKNMVVQYPGVHTWEIFVYFSDVLIPFSYSIRSIPDV